MAEKTKSVLVVCVDRDDDFGRKAGIEGPIIGKKANLNAAAKLALADPEDSDSNTVFAAVKKMQEAKKLYANVEVVTLTGAGKFGLESDKRINEQLDSVMEKFPADAFILVTDGAEDDQVLPILQSRAPVISKETLIIKQAKEIESAYYTIKEALRDPFLQKVVFGIPGLILLILIALPTIGGQVVVGTLGGFLIIYGFGLFDRLASIVRIMAKSIKTQRASFPFYIATLFVFAFGVIGAYTVFYSLPQATESDIIQAGLEAAVQFIFFTFLSAELFIIGRTIDLVHLKRAYKIRNYFLSGISLILVWFILDSGKGVFAGKADLNSFLFTIASSFVAFLIVFKISEVFNVQGKITKLLVGLPVYNKKGEWVGKVEGISKDKKSIEYALIKSKEKAKAARTEFRLKQGRVLLSS
ncbi:MAG: DUF373 family protein [Candidatus Diapherotrites archaeon]|uniref:DUF373 family protein n=1 Tax=Candidatus Iainarchaeum sp. TaxID=3101447 RepID=A0A7J4KU27_9ARCH|nr:DUF373 family protein [Candidatus Diapherotrites archaeon]HIH21095.1 DUF373 family protein [Candidatus Diapherotrites archaeon]HIH33432.1 DUF373 family protein [Candidatus Diapherotrites archaeon]